MIWHCAESEWSPFDTTLKIEMKFMRKIALSLTPLSHYGALCGIIRIKCCELIFSIHIHISIVTISRHYSRHWKWIPRANARSMHDKFKLVFSMVVDLILFVGIFSSHILFCDANRSIGSHWLFKTGTLVCYCFPRIKKSTYLQIKQMKENKTIKSAGREKKYASAKRNERSEQFAIESFLSIFKCLAFDIYNNKCSETLRGIDSKLIVLKWICKADGSAIDDRIYENILKWIITSSNCNWYTLQYEWLAEMHCAMSKMSAHRKFQTKLNHTGHKRTREFFNVVASAKDIRRAHWTHWAQPNTYSSIETAAIFILYLCVQRYVFTCFANATSETKIRRK